MTRPQKTDMRNKVLALLSGLEMDTFTLGQLAAIPDIVAILGDIISKPGKAGPYQVQNAAHMLGRLGDSAGLAALVHTLDSKDQALRLCALDAIKALKPNTVARKRLAQHARREDIDAAEKIHAHLALGVRINEFGELLPRRPSQPPRRTVQGKE